MKRTKKPVQVVDDFGLPDIINCSIEGDFTQIPNRILRDPELSFRAKGLLCLLLSNRDGWRSYVTTIQSMTTDGRDTIYRTIRELEQAGYLLRAQYRSIDTKAFGGIIWAYTDTPNSFNINAMNDALRSNNMEINDKGAAYWKAVYGFAVYGKSDANNTNRNNTKGNEEDTREDASKQTNSLLPHYDRITPSMFETFWKLYPRKVDKGKAKTKWNQLCHRKDRPIWIHIQQAIQRQSSTDRWADPKFIPHPTTWLNQERWLDDPEAMNDGAVEKVPAGPTADALIASAFNSSAVLSKQFIASCLSPALGLVGSRDESTRAEVARRLITMYRFISDKQDSFSSQLRSVLPGPMEVVENYIQWIDSSSWITDHSPRMFEIASPLFGKYRRWEASRDTISRDPITGESINLG